MCRWLAYSGTPIKLEELLLKREHSLIDQSLHSRMGATTTNGDGFGVGWYDEGETPRVYRSTHPAWNDRNLKELAAGISSPLFFAHIRSSTGSAIQETNTHPFRYGKWLWMHNGLIRDFPKVHRELVKDIDPALIGVSLFLTLQVARLDFSQLAVFLFCHPHLGRNGFLFAIEVVPVHSVADRKQGQHGDHFN